MKRPVPRAPGEQVGVRGNGGEGRRVRGEGLVHANFPDITGIEALAFASSAIFDSALGGGAD